MLQHAKRTATELENKLEIAMLVMDILKFKTDEDLEALDIKDKTSITMDASKLITKNKSQTMHDKRVQLVKDVNSFKENIQEYINQGLPSPWDGNRDLNSK